MTNVTPIITFEHVENLGVDEVDRKMRDARNQLMNAHLRMLEVAFGIPLDGHVGPMTDVFQRLIPLMNDVAELEWQIHVAHGLH